MKQIIEQPLDERTGLFTEAGLELGIDPFYVEKDFWVCWVLGLLFSHEKMGPHLTFRGGTSLSKGWGLIARFSEDVDLALGRDWVAPNMPDPGDAGLTPSQWHNRLKKLRKNCRQIIQDELIPLLEKEVGELGDGSHVEVVNLAEGGGTFVIAVHYPLSGFEIPGDYHKAEVKIEISGRADDWPQEGRPITPYVVEALPQLKPWTPLTIPCVKPERTFWEKASLLHERHTRPEDRQLPPGQSRHLYDLTRLWAHIKGMPGLEALFEGVKTHRNAFFNSEWVDYEQLKPTDLVLVPPDGQIAAWRADYQSMEPMFRGDPPAFDTLIKSIAAIEQELGVLR